MDPQLFHYYQLLVIDNGGIAFILCLYVLYGLLEMIFPAETNQRMPGRLVNVVVSGLFILGGGFLTKVVLTAMSVGRPPAPDRGILVTIALVIGFGFAQDFLFYWYHRAQHRIGVLWPLHELHHTDQALNATTSFRTIWLESPIQAALLSVPAGLIIGFDRRSALILPVLYTVWLLFAHANLRINMGFLTPWICGPQLHRIHHSNLAEHHNKNFAQFFPCIDVLFGTYYRPRRNEFPTTGIPQRKEPATLSELTIGPFQPWVASLTGHSPARPETPARRAPRKQRRSR